MTPLPVPLDLTGVRDLADLVERMQPWTRDVDDYLRGQPTLEVVEVEIDPADLPLTIYCQTPAGNVLGVARIHTVNKTDSALVTNTDLGWRQSSEAVGFEVSSLPGCSAGTTYAVTFDVIGRRE